MGCVHDNRIRTCGHFYLSISTILKGQGASNFLTEKINFVLPLAMNRRKDPPYSKTNIVIPLRCLLYHVEHPSTDTGQFWLTFRLGWHASMRLETLVLMQCCRPFKTIFIIKDMRQISYPPGNPQGKGL